jgi:hypothetical protein
MLPSLCLQELDEHMMSNASHHCIEYLEAHEREDTLDRKHIPNIHQEMHPIDQNSHHELNSITHCSQAMGRKECQRCLKPVSLPGITVDDYRYHSTCFVCSVCSKPLEGTFDFKWNCGELYCKEHANLRIQTVCNTCGNPINDRSVVVSNNREYHKTCFKCCVCCATLTEGHAWFIVDGKLLCENDSGQLKDCN